MIGSSLATVTDLQAQAFTADQPPFGNLTSTARYGAQQAPPFVPRTQRRQRAARGGPSSVLSLLFASLRSRLAAGEARSSAPAWPLAASHGPSAPLLRQAP